MKQSLTRQGLQAKYTFDLPKALRVPKILNTLAGIKAVFSDPSRFKVIYEKFGYGSILMFDDVDQYVYKPLMALHQIDPILLSGMIKTGPGFSMLGCRKRTLSTSMLPSLLLQSRTS
jgi:hypothetical protein